MFYPQRIAASLLIALFATSSAFATGESENQVNMPEIVVTAKKIDTQFGVSAQQIRTAVLGNLAMRLAEHNSLAARSAPSQLIASTSLN